MVKRGDFWIGLLILLLSLTMVLWGDITIDITLHDTYFVAHYSQFLYPTILWFSINLFLYNLLIRKKKPIGKWIQVSHILISYLTTFIYIFQFWGTTFALTGLMRRYFSTDADFHPDVKITGLNFLTFMAVQLIFTGTVVVKMAKR